MERVYFLLSVFLLGMVFTESEDAQLSFNWIMKLNRECSLGIYENEKTSVDYKVLKKEVENGIGKVYEGNSDFINASVQLFNCIGKDVMVGLTTKVKNMSATNLEAFNKVFVNKVNVTSSPAIMNSIETYKLNALPLRKRYPVLYAKLDGSLAGAHFCTYRSSFKENLAKTLILADGFSTANAAQVILYNNPCGSSEDSLLDNVQFYVSKKGMMGEPDIGLTNLAYRIVDQMIYDGTAWRLGLHLYKYLEKIELLGSEMKDSGLNDLEITYIGFGAVIGLIVLIIIIVWIVECSRNFCECCKKCCGDDEKDFHVSVHVAEPQNTVVNEKGITNELFQTEKYHAAEVSNDHIHQNHAYELSADPVEYDAAENHCYEPVADAVEYNAAENLAYEPNVDPVEMSPVSYGTNEPEYYELQNVESFNPSPVVLGTFNDQSRIVDEEPIDATYDNPVESGPADQELLAIPDFDSSSSSDESEFEVSQDLTVDDLGNVLSDQNGLLYEYEKLGNRVPGAMLYPEEVALKNRVQGCFPWPETRVPLSVDDPSVDYINASYVKNNQVAVSYIVTQGPLQSTTDDFWKMVMEQNIEIIVMVTPLNLRGQEMCHQYWPRDQNACSYGDIKVQLVKKELKPDFLVMTVAVSQGEAEPRQIYLFRYMSWPQSDIPDTPKSIIAFLLEVREVSETVNSLPVFHCSSGRGMSAVLIALLNGMVDVELSNAVNLKKIVRALRKDLPGAIESFEQYKFMHEAMYQYALFNAS